VHYHDISNGGMPLRGTGGTYWLRVTCRTSTRYDRRNVAATLAGS